LSRCSWASPVAGFVFHPAPNCLYNSFDNERQLLKQSLVGGDISTGANKTKNCLGGIKVKTTIFLPEKHQIRDDPTWMIEAIFTFSKWTWEKVIKPYGPPFLKSIWDIICRNPIKH